MANGENLEESSPLLGKVVEKADEKDTHRISTGDRADAVPPPPPVRKFAEEENGGDGCDYGWTADGLPIHGSVMGEPVGRAQWETGLCACLGRHDEFCSSDLEVCLIGSVAPCMLYGSNAERLGSTPGTFANHCMSYSGLYLIGTSFFGWNCLAPWFTFPTRTAIRRMFNLEGNCEALHRSCGCCGLCVEDEVQREHCESVCDFATHVFCHTCALCQEGRELRRRMPHPGFNARPVLVMIPPAEQSMGRGV
ncbi:cell number regulator 8-like [Cucurbita moschata]|uniref:Cell number regulator 8-like n=1 Tax=Cucurbita moschata TaxID=3662 RepID=A0A6J1EJW2_CUCMO|nr:cell number regulator 8-like [Cucurbita moschata]